MFTYVLLCLCFLFIKECMYIYMYVCIGGIGSESEAHGRTEQVGRVPCGQAAG